MAEARESKANAPATMRAVMAVSYGALDKVLELRQIPIPLCGPRDVLVRVHAAGVNPVDFKTVQGMTKAAFPRSTPFVVGFELSGVVVGLGAEASKWKVGDQVFGRVLDVCMGTLSDYAAVREDVLAKKPENVTHVEAAAMPLVCLTALQCLRKLRLQRGERILITAGAGGVGAHAIQLAKNIFEAHVTVTASGPKAPLCQQLGADAVIDYRQEKLEEKVADMDAALDNTAETERIIPLLKRGGRIASISTLPSGDEIKEKNKDFCMNPVQRFFVGVYLNFATRKYRSLAESHGVEYQYVTMSPDGANMEELRTWIEAGKLRAVVDKTFPLERAKEALQYVESGRATGKVVVTVAE